MEDANAAQTDEKSAAWTTPQAYLVVFAQRLQSHGNKQAADITQALAAGRPRPARPMFDAEKLLAYQRESLDVLSAMSLSAGMTLMLRVSGGGGQAQVSHGFFSPQGECVRQEEAVTQECIEWLEATAESNRLLLECSDPTGDGRSALVASRLTTRGFQFSRRQLGLVVLPSSTRASRI